MGNAALTETWRKYRGWAARARAIRAELDRWRLRVLGLTVAGAVLATLASQLPVWFGSTDLVGVAEVQLSPESEFTERWAEAHRDLKVHGPRYVRGSSTIEPTASGVHRPGSMRRYRR